MEAWNMKMKEFIKMFKDELFGAKQYYDTSIPPEMGISFTDFAES